MNRLKTALIYGCIFATVCLLLGWTFRTDIALLLAKRTITRNVALEPLAQLPDGLHVALCGTGSPFPDPQRAGPCTAVIAGSRMFVVDAGSGAARNLQRMRLPVGSIEAVLLTHFHSDHIDGLGELLLQRWVSNANTLPVKVFGPTGVEAVVGGLMSAYSQDRDYRVGHHGAYVVPPSGFGANAQAFKLDKAANSVVLFKDADLEILAFEVDHGPVKPAMGYLFRYKGRSVLISGDTRKSANLEAHAAGVDVLLHEALAPNLVSEIGGIAQAAGRPALAQIMSDIQNYHTTPSEAAQIAENAKVGLLVFNHIVPPIPLSALEDLFLQDARNRYSGALRIGQDGDFISLPAAGGAFTVSNRL
jgi:ribonuclease Z